MLRWLRWRWAKRRLASILWRYPPRHVKLRSEYHDATPEAFPPNAASYETLAALWNDCAAWGMPNYRRFLIAASRQYARPIQSVLDLACGTGLVTRQLARRFATVVGLDCSAAMLRE